MNTPLLSICIRQLSDKSAHAEVALDRALSEKYNLTTLRQLVKLLDQTKPI